MVDDPQTVEKQEGPGIEAALVEAAYQLSYRPRAGSVLMAAE
jgi:hypothetical protein